MFCIQKYQKDIFYIKTFEKQFLLFYLFYE